MFFSPSLEENVGGLKGGMPGGKEKDRGRKAEGEKSGLWCAPLVRSTLKERGTGGGKIGVREKR